MNKYNIAIIAEAGAGKDFLADYLIENYGYSRYAFADNVKLVAETWFPELYGDAKEKPRWLLQAVGTMFREIDEQVWIKAMLDDIESNKRIREKNKHSKEFIVVTDCRLPNEYQALKEEGYTFVRLHTSPELRAGRMRERGDRFNEQDLKHHSESFYNEFECDYEIENNGTPEELYARMSKIMNQVIER